MRRRILQLAMAVCVVSVALFALPLGLAVRQNALSQERDELERHALRIAVALDPHALSQPLPPSLVAGDETAGAYDLSGARRSGAGPARDPLVRLALQRQDLVYSHAEDGVTVVLPVLDGDHVVAAVRLQTRDLDVWRRSWRTWLGLAALAALALGVGLLVAWRLATRLARPLQQLEGVATRLGSGDFSVRSARSGIPEIDSVGASLDSTAARLDDLVETERRLTRDASHQLRTPLTGLRLRLETGLAGPSEELPGAVTAALERLDVVDATMSDLLEGHRPAPLGPNVAVSASRAAAGARPAAAAGGGLPPGVADSAGWAGGAVRPGYVGHPHRAIRSDEPEDADHAHHSGHADQASHPAHADQASYPDHADQPPHPAHASHPDQASHRDQPAHPDQAPHAPRSSHSEQPQYSRHSGQLETEAGSAGLQAAVVAEEVSRRWGPELTSRGRRLLVQEDEAPPTTATLPALRQAVDVLVDNAVAHGEGDVTVILRDAHGALAIDVVDQGPGVALADDVLFEHGTTTRPSGKGGLGLALARRLVESQGGRLLVRRPVTPGVTATAATDEPTGAWFTVIVPAADLEEDSSC